MKTNTDFIPFALPSIGKEEEDAVLQVMRSGWLTTGAVAKAFEEDFKSLTKCSYAISVNSATSGLHLALEALGIGKGDFVVMSPYTFTATAEVVRYLGAEVIFVDTEKDSYNIDAEKLSLALKAHKNIKAIIPVHIGGLACNMKAILELAKEYKIPVVEDAAHAFPLTIKEGFVGALGIIGVYSFYATKTITTGEGGMVVTNDEALAKRMLLMRLHGIDRDVFNRYTSKNASWRYAVTEPGFKYNMTDIAAAIGREQLKKADSFLKERTKIASLYDEAFKNIKGLSLPPRRVGEAHAYHLYALTIHEKELGITRDDFIENMKEKGVGTSVHFIPLHIMPYYEKRYNFTPNSFPNAFNNFSCEVSLPIYQGMTEGQIDRVIQAVKDICNTK